jgi:hypothetical protein
MRQANSRRKVMMADEPLYTSPCAARSLWHEYRVYAGWVELDTLTGTLAVPFDRIEAVHVADSFLKGVRLQLAGFRPGVKLDLVDFHAHVVIDKTTGMFRHLAFTPDDTGAFRAALEGALASYRAAPPGSR